MSTVSTTTDTVPGLIHLRQAGVSVVLKTSNARLPRMLHWGADLGPLSATDLAQLDTAVTPPFGTNPTAVAPDFSILPEFERGWIGRPGVEGSRAGRDWSPDFRVTSQELRMEPGTVQSLRVHASDEIAKLSITVEIELLVSGLIRARAGLRNDAIADPYTVGGLRITYPVPTEADELLDFTGRHLMERVPQRSEFAMGLHSREVRAGITGLDAAYLLIAGPRGFEFRSGEVWGTHVAYSGNQVIYAERINNGARVLGGGELLQHSEIVLEQAQSYQSPWFYGAYAYGLDELAGRFHRELRSRQAHPSTPRPVVVNTWEAVYFDHDLEKLSALAVAAAGVGVERFVLDDGWFGSRRDDTSGLGDWTVSSEVWPQGLSPLIDRVTSLGMDFGLWVEPEMVNLDSDLARAHPEWLFSAGGRVGYASRHQHVLDLTHEGAYEHILSSLDALLTEYDIAYLKWDHNRQLVEAGHTPGGEPAIHGQTQAVYRLMDELKRRHPGLEIESCASGAGRVDLGIIEHTDRVWGSDCNDPVERAEIHRYSQLLLPPELIGAHIGPSPSHTTLRHHGMQFRAGTAVWCHLGVEDDLTLMTDVELEDLAEWIRFYRAHRELLHSGTVVNVDHPDESLYVHGVVSVDRSDAIFSVASLRRSVTAQPGQLRIPGLDAARRYRVTLQPPAAGYDGLGEMPAWVDSELVLTGRVLGSVGLQVLPLHPEHLYFIRLRAEE